MTGDRAGLVGGAIHNRNSRRIIRDMEIALKVISLQINKKLYARRHIGYLFHFVV